MLYIRYRIKKFRKKEQENKLLIREIVEAFAKEIDMKDKYTFLRLVENGEFRASDDNGGGTFEDIENIRKKYDKQSSVEHN